MTTMGESFSYKIRLDISKSKHVDKSINEVVISFQLIFTSNEEIIYRIAENFINTF